MSLGPAPIQGGLLASGGLLGAPVGTVVLLAALSLLPFAFMTLTSFVKISTVLQIVRGAIGAQGIPSSTVVLALSLALTLISMAPVGARIIERVTPVWSAPTQNPTELVRGMVGAAAEPVRSFLRRHTSERESSRYFELARSARTEPERGAISRDDFVVLVPAFITSELGEAFALGFAIYLPFLIIDLVIGNILLALGMQTLNPTQVSLPFKLLLFVAVDGWGLLSQALVAGYRSG